MKCRRRNSGKERTSEILENDATRESPLQAPGNDWDSPASLVSKTPFTGLSQELEFIEGSKRLAMHEVIGE